ncbi:MAG: alpha/beta fold hydrolase [Zoogloeaceae bacterium]|nr:alpha/beta fold hydrolase [Zoogloeaceae bacterium]
MAHAAPLFSPVFFGTIVRSLLVMPLLRASTRTALAIAPAWVARTTARRFITPPRIGHTPPELELLKKARRLTTASPMGQLATWQFGDSWRPAVIVSHGWGGRGAQFREFVPALMEAGYQVWMFDHVSHGMSEGREAPITDFARGLASVVRAAEASGARVSGLIGHSLGAAGIGIALRHELGNPAAIRVVQIAPPASLIRYSHQFARMLGLPEALRAGMQWRLERRIGKKWQEFELPGAVAPLQQKALVIHDENDKETRLDDGLQVAKSWPDARFKRTRGLGHNRILRDAEVIRAAIDFLAGSKEFPLPGEDEASSPPIPAPLY